MFCTAKILKFETGRRLFENFRKFEERSSNFLEIRKCDNFQMNDAYIFFALYRAFEFPFAQILGPESIHNIYNVPLEPERAAKARRAVVASSH